MTENGHAAPNSHRPELVRTHSEATDFDQTAKLTEDILLHAGEAMVPPPAGVAASAHIRSMSEYRALYSRSMSDNDGFWREMATTHLSWFAPFTSVSSGSLSQGDVAWFLNGRLNAAYNCIDRHLPDSASKTAILWEGDEPTDIRRLTYSDLFALTCRLANVLRRRGVKKGDTVCIYFPNVPEAVVAMLACARIGAPHSVVFAGFSPEALRERVEDGHCTVVLTADEGKRGGKTVPLKAMVDAAISGVESVRSVIVYKHTGSHVMMKDGRDHWWHELMAAERGYAQCEPMDSEDTLFMLFTSGSTGKPKGIQHATAGYLLHTMLTCRFVFDVHPTSVYACMADVGWITGHSYIVYGPLLNGATTFLFESTPTYPDAGRYWAMVERHRLTQLYTAPTAIRALMKFGDEVVHKYDRSSLKVLGSVGEPINPEAWRWYYDVVGAQRCSIVDTYWQTETGGHMITPLPGSHPTKPGSATLPFFGVSPAILTPEGKRLEGNNVTGVLCIDRPWPGMARTIYGDHSRFLHTYLSTYPGYYFTGDGCLRDDDGYYWITGRVDDVINVSGHRIGSAEIESALVLHHSVAESAVIGVPHDVKGQALFAYVIPKDTVTQAQWPALHTELGLQVREHIGAFAKPDEILITQSLPKTRSGKIMRRLLRKIACNDVDSLGDTSTLADESVVQRLIDEVRAMRKAKPAKSSLPSP